MAKKTPTATTYQSLEDHLWRWRLQGRNGEISIPPEGHSSARDAKRAFRTAQRLIAQVQEIDEDHPVA